MTPLRPDSRTPPSVPPLARILPFRPRSRRRDVRRLRRFPLLRFAKPFFLALLIVGAPVGVAAWAARSPQFALTEIDVVADPQGRVPADWVRRTLGPLRGHNLPRLPLDGTGEVLERHPWVASVDLYKELPGRLRVRVVEKKAVALERTSKGDDGPDLWYVDQDGALIAPFEPASSGADLVLITAATGAHGVRAALDLLAEIDRVAPPWAAGLSEIEVLGEEDFRVWSADLPFPLLLRSGALEKKEAYLEKLLPEVFRRYGGVRAVDLRFARRIIVQPSAQDSRWGLGVRERG